MNCKICNASEADIKQNLFNLNFYLSGGEILKSKIHKCRLCGTYFRSENFSNKRILSHFDVASYTKPDYENYFYKGRINFFRYLLQKTKLFIHNSDCNLLDIGCSYGHLLEVFKNANQFKVFGIEIVDRLRHNLLKKGYNVFKYIQDVPEDLVFDVITCIDSLYLFEEPSCLLTKISKYLKENGILIIRVTNKTFFLNLFYFLKLQVPYSFFGDAKYSFSYCGLKKILYDSGFIIKKMFLYEKGKKESFGIKWFLYKISPIFYYLTGILISPGILLFCKKQTNN